VRDERRFLFAHRSIFIFAGHSSDIISLAASENGKLAISGEQKKHARVWEIETGMEVANITGFEGQVKAVHLTRDGKLALATDGAMLIEYDLNKNEVKRRRPLTRSWAAGQAAAISPDGEMIAVGDSYNIRLWNLKTGAEGKPLVSNDIQWSMAFTPDGSKLVSGASGSVNVWDTKKHTRLYVQALSGTGYVQSIAVSADGRFFAAPGSSASKLQVFRFTK
jgi:WD40 repeat protein